MDDGDDPVEVVVIASSPAALKKFGDLEINNTKKETNKTTIKTKELTIAIFLKLLFI